MTTYPLEDSVEYDALLTGPRQWYRELPVTLSAGQSIVRGALLTSSDGVTVTAVAATTDTVFGIAKEDVDAADADTETVVWVSGDFNVEAVDAGDLDASDFILAARNVGILLRSPS